MSQRRSRRNLNASSQSQMNETSSCGNQSLSQASPEAENYDECTVAAMKFILNQLATKLPVKRVDLVKNSCTGNSKIFQKIQSSLQNRLKLVYGIILHELKSAKGASKQYICFANNPSAPVLQMGKSDRRIQTLLVMILSYIFIKGESVGESGLMNFLERLGIDIEKEHEWFGDVKKCMETFRKQLYLKREKQQMEASNEEKITLEWGERALMEFDKKTMLINIAELLHKPTFYLKKLHMDLMVEAENMEE